ncbi:hypothetical protein RY966_004217 [Enterobacter kobei]|nr:hypothetical protein [Enterobacter kobei]
MGLKTGVYTLGREWRLLSDGINTSFVTAEAGRIEFVSADTEPSDDARGHTVVAGESMTITPPTVIWGRSATKMSARVALSAW